MGSYHSYVGDAKLEDSKDNWYRISGLNISRWNITPTRSSDTSTLRPSGIPVYTKLNNNDIGWYLGDKSIYSDAYVKILKDLSGDTVHNNMYDKVKISGRLFDLKGNTLSLVNINVNDTHRYNGEIQKDISIVNADGGNVQLRPNYLVRDSNNKIYIYNSDPSNTSSSFRPMLTLKPVGGGVINIQNGIALNAYYEAGEYKTTLVHGTNPVAYIEWLFIPENPKIRRLIANYGSGNIEELIRWSPEDVIDYTGPRGYFISYLGEYPTIPSKNYRYSDNMIISVITQDSKTYNYHITKGELISSAGRYSKYKAIQTEI